MADLILTFEWDGKTIHKETKGFTGSTCVSDTKFIEEALGKASNRKYKAEYYEQETQSESERVKN